MTLPYFKFMVQDWLSGDIQACDFRTQGLFTNIMAHVWKNEGCYSKPIAVLSQRLHVPLAELEAAIEMLRDLGVLYVDGNGYIRIKFMDEQLGELTQTHEQKVLAGKKGAAVRYGKHSHSTAIAPPKHTDTDTDTDTNTAKKRFVPPTPEEVEEYSRSIGYPVVGQAWCDSYAQKNWMVGKNKMKDWKCAVRNWKAQGWLPSKPKNNQQLGTANGAVI